MKGKSLREIMDETRDALKQDDERIKNESGENESGATERERNESEERERNESEERERRAHREANPKLSPKDEEARQRQLDRMAKHWSDGPDPLEKFKGEPRLFVRKTAAEWMDVARNMPEPKMLFSELWYEHELCILFSDTNLGKSILAMQIAESIATGKAVDGFKLEVPAQKVLYFDFELTPKQFANRYKTKEQGEHRFIPNLLRLALDPLTEIPANYNNYESFTIHSIEREILETGAKVLIIDNITYLNYDNEKARDATPFMKQLHELRDRLYISILVITHTPKRDATLPLEIKDVAGSSAITRFIDSIFGIGPSQKDPALRYIKQLKMRACEHIYHARNVLVCRVEMPDNFLKFKFLDMGVERDHLSESNERDRSELIARVKELHAEGKTQRETADLLGIGTGTVCRYLKM